MGLGLQACEFSVWFWNLFNYGCDAYDSLGERRNDLSCYFLCPCEKCGLELKKELSVNGFQLGSALSSGNKMN